MHKTQQVCFQTGNCLDCVFTLPGVSSPLLHVVFFVCTLNVMTNTGDGNVRARLGQPCCQHALETYHQILLKLFFPSTRPNSIKPSQRRTYVRSGHLFFRGWRQFWFQACNRSHVGLFFSWHNQSGTGEACSAKRVSVCLPLIQTEN